MMKTIAKFQIGKFGVTPGVIESLKLAFKNHKQMRISVLKSSGRTRESIKEMAEEISKGLADQKHRYVCRIIGFTIVMNQLRAKRM